MPEIFLYWLRAQVLELDNLGCQGSCLGVLVRVLQRNRNNRCVCVCVCGRERETEMDGWIDRLILRNWLTQQSEKKKK